MSNDRDFSTKNLLFIEKNGRGLDTIKQWLQSFPDNIIRKFFFYIIKLFIDQLSYLNNII